jgi:hypothetical protein
MPDPVDLDAWREDLANEYGDNGADRWRERCQWLLAENERLREVAEAGEGVLLQSCPSDSLATGWKATQETALDHLTRTLGVYWEASDGN